MEIVAVPHSALHEQVLSRDGLPGNEEFHTTGDAQRVVERAHGVDGGVEEGTMHLGTDVVAETRPQEHHAVAVMQPTPVLARFYCRPELHLKLKMVVLTDKDKVILEKSLYFNDII